MAGNPFVQYAPSARVETRTLGQAQRNKAQAQAISAVRRKVICTKTPSCQCVGCEAREVVRVAHVHRLSYEQALQRARRTAEIIAQESCEAEIRRLMAAPSPRF